MMKKLKSKKGETLIEALVSILIAVLAMGLVCSAVVATSNMNKRNRERDEKFTEELKQAEIYEGTSETKDMVIQFGDDTVKTVTVDVFGMDGRFASFRKGGE